MFLANAIVAGQVAVWLLYDDVPFDMTPGSVAWNVRDCLATSLDAGWGRNFLKMIWNQVTEENNTPLPPPSPAGGGYPLSPPDIGVLLTVGTG